MTDAIFVSSSEPRCGKSLISLGLVNHLLNKALKVGVYKPIITPNKENAKDRNLELLLEHFDLDEEYESSYALTKKEALAMINHGKGDDVLDLIIEQFQKLKSEFDFLICEGTDYLGVSSEHEFDLNASVAKNLGTPVLLLGNAQGKSNEESISSLNMAMDLLESKDCRIYGVIANRVDENAQENLQKDLEKAFSHRDIIISSLPLKPNLSNPRISDVVEFLDAKVLYGSEYLNNRIDSFVVGAMRFQNVLPELKEKNLVLTPGDREEIVLSLLQAQQAKNYPSAAGILLTTKKELCDSVKKLLDGSSPLLPILSVESNTFETATRLKEISPYLKASDRQKTELGLTLFEEHMNLEKLDEQLEKVVPDIITPKMFEFNLLKRAKSDIKKIVLPEGTEPRILKASKILLDKGAVKLVLLGKPETIKEEIAKLNLHESLSQVEIINPIESEQYLAYASTLQKLREKKGMNLDQAKDLMADASYFGTMMVYLGDADGMVSGSINTTQHTIRPALQFVKTKPGVSVVSSIFFMCLEDKVLVYGDCAVNPVPNSEQLAEIAISSAETAMEFGLEPKVALLSYSSGSSGKGEEVEKVRKATVIAKEKRPDLAIEGPLQYDAAVDITVGQNKMPGSKIAGQANVLIFPDLNTGNNTYKAVQRETGAVAIGPVLQGLNKPVNDLSRGCTIDDIVNTVIITAIQAQA
ncbi:phosphate acetyltransferase [Algoriphagus sediminis]|uniref:Phosphate acetyltransferase n=1 Tax=Algoriphagus sediminis TaxID=3057113 RepID=A0ABT7Y904_9BACT|nr:phosphate acetyltransferase [Algoriphagus sediminis]MDN3202996.1 phosphate acetyltransferase [Algoriphagus sediminis]